MNTNITGKIERPLRKLISLLRDNGFDTFCSCGHFPRPYIQLEWSTNFAIHKLFYLLLDNGYKNYTINGTWDSRTGSKILEIVFNPRMPLAKLKDIKNAQKIKRLFILFGRQS